MTDSETVKMIVVLLPCIAFMAVALVAYIIETIRDRNSANLFEDEEGKKLLAYMTEED